MADRSTRPAASGPACRARPCTPTTAEFIGAVAYGLAFGPSKIGGLAAADDMVKRARRAAARAPRVAQAPGRPAQGDRRRPAPSPPARRRPASSACATPLAVSGLGAGRINAFANRLAGHERFIPFAAGAARGPPTGDPAEIVPGGNFAAAISYGEITAAGVGTTTLVCGGKAVAFGHPFNFDGPTALSAHTADAILIQDDPLGAPFKLANIGGDGRHARPGPPERHPRDLRRHARPGRWCSSKVNQPGAAPFGHVTQRQPHPGGAGRRGVPPGLEHRRRDRPRQRRPLDGRLDRDRHGRRQAVLADPQQQVRRPVRHLVLHA